MKAMNNDMEYKGYHAIIEYDGQDQILVGTVIGLNDMLGFHGTSIEELITSFKNCIDNYLEWCKEAGKDGNQSAKRSIGFMADGFVSISSDFDTCLEGMEEYV